MTKEEYLKKKEEEFWSIFKGTSWSGKYRFLGIHLNQPGTCYYIDFCRGTMHCGFAVPRVYHKEGNAELKLVKKDIEQLVEKLHSQMDEKDIVGMKFYKIRVDKVYFEFHKEILKGSYSLEYIEKNNTYIITFNDKEAFDLAVKKMKGAKENA